jgi:hypothetical protein
MNRNELDYRHRNHLHVLARQPDRSAFSRFGNALADELDKI